MADEHSRIYLYTLFHMELVSRIFGFNTPGSTFDPYAYGDIVWFEIFLRCDRKTLMKVEKTCRYFKSLLNNRFWIAKCHFDNVAIPSPAWTSLSKPLPIEDGGDQQSTGEPKQQAEREEYNFNYKLLSFKNPLNRNLGYPMEKDTTLELLETRYGLRFEQGGDGIAVERVPANRGDMLEDERVKSCLATSYGWCRRYFEVDLGASGLDPAFIDHVRPKIVVRELCCSRSDCAAKYIFHAQLLKEGEEFDQNVILPRFKSLTKEWTQWEGGQMWETVEHIFENYPSGVRKIGILTSGQDTQFWKGHYGPKFTNTEILITMPDEPVWRNKNDVEEPEKIVNGHEDFRFMGRPAGLRARGMLRLRRNH